jgi:hypothetical protein
VWGCNISQYTTILAGEERDLARDEVMIGEVV